jgi:hypothetical protein
MAAKKKARKAKAKAKAKKGAKRKASWGGKRKGAGRPKGSGQGPSPNSRRNRVAVMFTDTELKKLNGLAKKQRVPIATAAYNLIAANLKRA